MDQSKNAEWLSYIPAEDRGSVESFVANLINKIKKSTAECFLHSSLYLVGSSLTPKRPNDYDIVLVGLAFQEIFSLLHTPAEYENERSFPDISPEIIKLISDTLNAPLNAPLNPTNITNPLRIYGNEPGRKYLVVEKKIWKIHLMIHAENLFVTSWERHQRTEGKPFLCLHEWPQSSELNIWNRPMWVNKIPRFIDPLGNKRATEF